MISNYPDQEGNKLGSMSGTCMISTTSRHELSSSFFVLQGKAPKEIHAILTETLACFLPGRAKDLSARLWYHLGLIYSSKICAMRKNRNEEQRWKFLERTDVHISLNCNSELRIPSVRGITLRRCAITYRRLGDNQVYRASRANETDWPLRASYPKMTGSSATLLR